MLSSVDFLSKAAFQQVSPAPDMAVISIGDPAEMPPEVLYKHAHVLRLEFLDCNPVDLEDADRDFPDEAFFQPKDAADVVAFIAALHAAPAAMRLVVHCHLGMSRSAAIALTAHAMTGCEFPRHAESNYAQPFVISLCEVAIGKTICIPPKPAIENYDFLPSWIQI